VGVDVDVAPGGDVGVGVGLFPPTAGSVGVRVAVTAVVTVGVTVLVIVGVREPVGVSVGSSVKLNVNEVHAIGADPVAFGSDSGAVGATGCVLSW